MDLESWLLLMDAEHRREMLTVLEPPKPIGYSGRSGRGSFLMSSRAVQACTSCLIRWRRRSSRTGGSSTCSQDGHVIRDSLGCS